MKYRLVLALFVVACVGYGLFALAWFKNWVGFAMFLYMLFSAARVIKAFVGPGASA